MFPLVSAATIVPILFIAFFALDSYALLLVGGFFLGIGGTAFAVGVPFVNAWFPPERRGLAIGIFGAGMGGTAISALTTVKLFTNVGEKAPFLITAVRAGGLRRRRLAGPARRPGPDRADHVPGAAGSSANARLPITWQACILYAVAFGGYVAFSVYLPAYLKTAYGLTPADAANRMAGFVRGRRGHAAGRRLALRPVRRRSRCWPPGTPSSWSCAAISAGTPPLERIGTVAFLAMAAALGSGSGATFALIAKVTDPSRVGGVTGLVGAAGGLGGFVPPLIMGYVYGRTDSYAIGLWLLSVTAALTLVLTLTVVRRTAAPRPGDRRPHDERDRDTTTGMDGRRSTRRARAQPAVLHQGRRSPTTCARCTKVGGREADDFYRDRWSHDKVVRSTHGVNCTGSCSWKVYVKDGIITWETQQTDYPSVGPDSPEYEPRGCPRGAAFSWYTYSPDPGPLPLRPRRPAADVPRGQGPARRRPGPGLGAHRREPAAGQGLQVRPRQGRPGPRHLGRGHRDRRGRARPHDQEVRPRPGRRLLADPGDVDGLARLRCPVREPRSAARC